MNIYIEKAECHNDAENNELIMSDEKCKSCDFYSTCRYVKASYDDVMYDVMYDDDEC